MVHEEKLGFQPPGKTLLPSPLPTILRLSWELYFHFLMRLFSPFYLPFPFQVFSWCPTELCLSTSTARHPSGSNISKGSKAIPHHRSTSGLLHRAKLWAMGSPGTVGTRGDHTMPQGAGGG